MNLEKENIAFELAICIFCDQEGNWTRIINKLFRDKYPILKLEAEWYKTSGADDYLEKLKEEYYIYVPCICYKWEINICKKHWVELFKLFEKEL